MSKTYTKEQVRGLINNYPYYISRLKDLRKRYESEVGGGSIGQYGDESALPKPQGLNSDPVHNEVQRLMRMDGELNRLESKVKYLQNRWHIITDERMAMVLNLRLCGKDYNKIAKTLGISKSRVNQIITDICAELSER